MNKGDKSVDQVTKGSKKASNGKHTGWKMLLWAFVGAIFGIVSSGLLDRVVASGLGIWIQDSVWQTVLNQVLWIHLIVSVGFVGAGGYFFLKAKKTLVVFKNEKDDDVLEILERSFDQSLYVTLTLVTSYFAINMMILSVEIVNKSGKIIGVVGLFIISMILASYLEIKSIRMIQEKDPKHIGDPASLEFSKQWIETCDEVERIIIYKSAYRSFEMTKYLLYGLMCLTMLTQLTLDTGIYPVIIVGGIWIFNSVTYNMTAMKLSKKKVYL
jgi:hypothetical protein